MPIEEQNLKTTLHEISKKPVYFSLGAIAESISLTSKLYSFYEADSEENTVQNEWYLLSHLCGSLAHSMFSKAFASHSAGSYDPLSSWNLNQNQLSRIPVFNQEDREKLHFLQQHWLAKSTGFLPFFLDWIYPCAGIALQVHPETSHIYARSPALTLPKTYTRLISDWKRYLPYPTTYPLLLTRPYDIHKYLPSCHELGSYDHIDNLLDFALSDRIILDCTSLFFHVPQAMWPEVWKKCEEKISHKCLQTSIPPSQIICIQRIQEKQIGGILILPLSNSNDKILKEHTSFLLSWISTFGLTANRIELDRSTPPPCPMKDTLQASPVSLPQKEFLLSTFIEYANLSQTKHPQKNLMIQASFHLIEGLLQSIPQEKWDILSSHATWAPVISLYVSNIQKIWEDLIEEKENDTFFDTVSRLEQIHASLSALLEILSPYSPKDFPHIYSRILTIIPPDIRQHTSYGVHASGMTSLSGILKAVETMNGKKPCVVYGENIYYECIHAIQKTSQAISLEDMQEGNWEQIDLILAQFQPVLKRVDLIPSEYKLEKVEKIVEMCLLKRSHKPVTLALDCTLDFINSPLIQQLLSHFQEDIKQGNLNVICFRSGLKFDLFGMDNYCGSPFFIIHNSDSKWNPFSLLTEDKALQTDLLSLNWFCLAYQFASSELEQYRKQIFDNTRNLLRKAPIRLLCDPKTNYKIIPIAEDANAGFLDIKITGPFHKIRGAFLGGGTFYTKCLEKKQPLFSRLSFGFYHSNLTMIFDKKCTTIRLTVGLDPKQIDLLAYCFKLIDTLNENDLPRLQGILTETTAF